MSEPTTSRNPGKLVVIAIIVAAIGLAALALGYHTLVSRRVIGFWGAAAAQAILNSPRVRLEPLGDEQASGAEAASRDIGQVPGMLNVRHALTQDRTYQWAAPVAAAPAWQYALEFSGTPETVRVLLELSAGTIGNGRTGQAVALHPAIRAGLARFIAEQLSGERKAVPAGATRP